MVLPSPSGGTALHWHLHRGNQPFLGLEDESPAQHAGRSLHSPLAALRGSPLYSRDGPVPASRQSSGDDVVGKKNFFLLDYGIKWEYKGI